MLALSQRAANNKVLQSIDRCFSFLDYCRPSEFIYSFIHSSRSFSYPRITARSRMREWVSHQTKLIISSIGIFQNQVRRFLLHLFSRYSSLHVVVVVVVFVFVRHYLIVSCVSHDLFSRCIGPSLSYQTLEMETSKSNVKEKNTSMKSSKISMFVHGGNYVWRRPKKSKRNLMQERMNNSSLSSRGIYLEYFVWSNMKMRADTLLGSVSFDLQFRWRQSINNPWWMSLHRVNWILSLSASLVFVVVMHVLQLRALGYKWDSFLSPSASFTTLMSCCYPGWSECFLTAAANRRCTERKQILLISIIRYWEVDRVWDIGICRLLILR